MADISKITLPNDPTLYDVKDTEAREQISILSNHIIFSNTQPASNAQVAGDIWVILKKTQEEHS
jgi:hypothetical protein